MAGPQAQAFAYFIVSPDPEEYPPISKRNTQGTQYAVKFGQQNQAQGAVDAYERANPSFWWCDLEIQVWNPGTYNKQFAMYLQEKVIENFNFRDPTSTAPFRHTEYGNEWFWCRNNETRLNGTTGIQPVMNALSTTNNVQTAMTTILNDHIQYITNTVIPDPNAPAVLQNWAAWWPNNIPTQYTNSARYMRRLIALDRSVERILNAAGRARAGAGLQNLLVDLNWLRNNVNNLVQVRNANDLNVRFLNHATAEVFFNYYLWTG